MSTNKFIEKLIGTGWVDPIDISVGSYESQRGIHVLADSIKRVLTTKIGERVMRPKFGSDLWKILFSPLNDMIIVQLKLATISALQQWEPRVELLAFEIEEMQQAKQLNMILNYKIVGTGTVYKLIYPIMLDKYFT
jgi:hypothetical protein